MLECLILGDSIAVGTHMFKTQCVAYAKGGINSWQWNKMYAGNDLSANVVIISLGSNDHKNVKTRSEIERIRSNIKANRVYWILPAGNNPASGVDIQTIQSYVNDVAAEYKDVVLPINRLQRDGIHPSTAGYKDIVERIKQ